MPNDETEQDRLDLTHRVLFLKSFLSVHNLTETSDNMTLGLSGALHLAPIDRSDFPLHRILDCGTGTGNTSVM